MFVLPAGAFAIIGTTDTFTTASPDDVRATADDVSYLLGDRQPFFPAANLTADDVVSRVGRNSAAAPVRAATRPARRRASTRWPSSGAGSSRSPAAS